MKIMAIDYGDARTGVAISDALGWMTGQTAVIHSWNERKTRQTQMSLRFKELQVHLAQLIEAVKLVCHDEYSFIYIKF